MSFASELNALRALQNRFDAASRDAQQARLRSLAQQPLPSGALLVRYHDCLLFIAAHPGDHVIAALADLEFGRIERFTRAFRGRMPSAWRDHGMPWVPIVTGFSHDAVRWLCGHPDVSVALASVDASPEIVNAVFALTLPAIERAETSAGRSFDELVAALRVPRRDALAFVLREFARFDGQPLVKDDLFARLNLDVRIEPNNARFSKARNRLPMLEDLFFHTDTVKRFDVPALLDTPLPPPRKLNARQTDDAIRVLRNTMALTIRETDPASYLDARSLRIHDLERGLSCAIFGMTPDRQLPLESYMGFTLFKNGWPVAYGGSWVFGRHAAFGMNIFEPYRGGESGFMMAQVLRTYRASFGIDVFEVDAHQFGLDNPDGIASGAYWFYHRHGFRSIDKRLARVAREEKARIDAKPGYRSSDKTLIAFTGSDVALDLAPGKPRPVKPAALMAAATRMIAARWGGDREQAERTAQEQCAASTGRRLRDADAQRALREWAPVALALGVKDEAGWRLVERAAAAKGADVFGYQRALHALVPMLMAMQVPTLKAPKPIAPTKA